MEIELRPSRASNRPLVLHALDKSVEATNLQPNSGLIGPAVIDAFQKIVEETLLQQTPVIRVEVSPVLDAVQLEPLVRRCRAAKTLDIPAQVQPLTPPISCGEKRHRHFRPYWRARLVVIVVERMGEDFIAEITAIPNQLLVQKVLGPADEFTSDAAARAALAESILHGLHLHIVPIRPEGAENTAMVCHVAVPVGSTFPDAHRGEMRWL